MNLNFKNQHHGLSILLVAGIIGFYNYGFIGKTDTTAPPPTVVSSSTHVIQPFELAAKDEAAQRAYDRAQKKPEQEPKALIDAKAFYAKWCQPVQPGADAASCNKVQDTINTIELTLVGGRMLCRIMRDETCLKELDDIK